MNRFLPFVWCNTLLLIACSLSLAQQTYPGQDEAIAAIRKMGGGVEIDLQLPGKPVVKIMLYKGRTAGIGLAPLAKLPEVNWIGLHASSVTHHEMKSLRNVRYGPNGRNLISVAEFGKKLDAGEIKP